MKLFRNYDAPLKARVSLLYTVDGNWQYTVTIRVPWKKDPEMCSRLHIYEHSYHRQPVGYDTPGEAERAGQRAAHRLMKRERKEYLANLDGDTFYVIEGRESNI